MVFDEYPENTLAINWTLYNAADSNIDKMLKEAPGAEVLGMLPPKGPSGKLSIEEYYAESKRYVIPKDCPHPEEVVKLIDYLWSDEGWLLYEYGIEGEHYNMVDGEAVATEVITGSGNINAEYEKRGMNIQIIPRIFKPITKAQRALRPATVEEPWSKMYDYFEKGPFLIWLPRTQEETDITDNADLGNYISDSLNKFVKGEMSFDKWDDYQAQLKKMGLDELCAAYQGIYDRNYKK